MMPSFFPVFPSPVIWRAEQKPVDYAYAVQFMEAYIEKIRLENAPEMVWLLQHAPIYTAGTSAKKEDLITPNRFPVFHSGRGGQYTYHGPGQRILYVMLDLKRRRQDIRAFISALEFWIIHALASCGVQAERRENRIGVWIPKKNTQCEDKIAAIGVRIRQWISFHGVCVNIHPNLEHFSGIIPCGLSQYGITSLSALGKTIKMEEFDTLLKASFEGIFGDTFLFSEK